MTDGAGSSTVQAPMEMPSTMPATRAEEGAFPDGDAAGHGRARGDVDAGADAAIVIDRGSGIDDDAVADFGIDIDDGAGHDSDSGAEADAGRNGGEATDGVDEPETRGGEAVEGLAARAVVADGGEGVADTGDVKAGEEIVAAGDGDAEQRGRRAVRGAGGDFVFAGFLEDFDDDFGVAPRRRR